MKRIQNVRWVAALVLLGGSVLSAASAHAAQVYSMTGRFARSNGYYIDIPLLGNNPGGVPNCGYTKAGAGMTMVPGAFPIINGVNYTQMATKLATKATLPQKFANPNGCVSGAAAMLDGDGRRRGQGVHAPRQGVQQGAAGHDARRQHPVPAERHPARDELQSDRAAGGARRRRRCAERHDGQRPEHGDVPVLPRQRLEDPDRPRRLGVHLVLRKPGLRAEPHCGQHEHVHGHPGDGRQLDRSAVGRRAGAPAVRQVHPGRKQVWRHDEPHHHHRTELRLARDLGGRRAAAARPRGHGLAADGPRLRGLPDRPDHGRSGLADVHRWGPSTCRRS